MSLSDCTMCWNTPCTCGYGYQNWTIEKLRDQIQMLQQVLQEKQAYLQLGVMEDGNEYITCITCDNLALVQRTTDMSEYSWLIASQKFQREHQHIKEE